MTTFRCEDKTIAAAKPTNNERDVDGQDRVEIFLWDGKPNSRYHCIEIARQGAIHDYSARFYRKFDDAWSVPDGCEIKAVGSPEGYIVETRFPNVLSRRCSAVRSPHRSSWVFSEPTSTN